MKRLFLKSLNIERGEEQSVLLLLIQTIFLGTFFATFEISSTAMFLDIFGAEMLPKAFLVSGLVGIVLTLVYSKLQSSITFSKLSLVNLAFITILTAMSRLGFEVTTSKWLIFSILVIMGPLNVLGIVSFWGMAGRLFTLRQGKRLFGMIDSGQILGMMIISFSIPFLLGLLEESKNLIIISTSSAFVALILQMVIVRKFDLDKSSREAASIKKEESTEKTVNTFTLLFKDKYISLMALFVVLSMVSAFFIHFSFLSVTDINYPNAQELAGFLGVFTGVIMVFSFLFKTFIYSKLIKTYGLKVGLLVLPLLLGFFTIVAAITGSFTGYSLESDSFIFFFLLISLGKLFAQSLKASIETPAFKLFYQPLDTSIRYDIQAKIDGLVNEVAAFAGGIILVGLASLNFIELIHFSYILVIIVVVWAYVAFKLFSQYRGTLQDSLARAQSGEKVATETESYMKLVIADANVNSNPAKLVYALRIAEQIEPYFYQNSLVSLLKSKFDHVKKYCLEKIIQLKLYQANNEFGGSNGLDFGADLNALAKDAEEALAKDMKHEISAQDLVKLAKSRTTADRKRAANLSALKNDEKLVPALRDLLKDADEGVRKAAIRSLAKNSYESLYPILIDNLSIQKYLSEATASIVLIGEACIEYLEHAFYKSGTSTETMIAISRIYGFIGGEQAVEKLVKKVAYPDNRVAKQVIKSLRLCDFKSDEESSNQIHQAVELYIGVAAWNMAAIIDLKEREDISYLIDALNEELAENYNQIYMLLSLVYDAQSIAHVRENIETGTGEGIGFAIELLDLFINEDLKPKLFPLLEDLPVKEKIIQLQTFYPLDRHNIGEVIQNVINRDYNFINRWTKACALNALMEIEDVSIEDYIVANLFNPSQLLRESAARVINKYDGKVYKACKQRIGEELFTEIDFMLSILEKRSSHLMFEKTLFLLGVPQFKNISAYAMAELSEMMKESWYKKDEVIYNRTSSINQISFIKAGSAVIVDGGKVIVELGPLDPVGEMLIIDGDSENLEIVASEELELYSIERDHFYHIMFHHVELSNALINMMDIRYNINKGMAA